MAHSWSFRTLVLLWALWFTASLSEAGGLHACPVHGGGVGNVAGHVASGGHDAAAALGHHGHEAPSGSEKSHGEHQACTCLGLCCCTGPVALPIPEQGIEVATVARAPDATYPEPHRVDTERAYAHPYANGPPARV